MNEFAPIGEMNEQLAKSVTTRTYTPNQVASVQTGWVCPKCGRGLAPHTSYCPCYMERPTVTYRAGDNGLYSTNAPNGEDWVATNGLTNRNNNL